jgi:uncharacterized lipoprotein YmbA
MKKTISALILTTLLLTGCFTPPMGAFLPTHYYRLDLPAPAATMSDAKSPDKLLIKVQTADSLRGPRIVMARSDYELFYEEEHRWSEPLSKGVSRLMAEQLSPFFAEVQSVPTPSGFAPTQRVEVTIEKLWGTPRGEIILEADWTITDAHDSPIAAGHQTFREKGWNTGNYQAFAERVSKLVGELSKAVRESLSTLDAAKK